MSYITLKDVAEQAGVSLATASQAIRGVGRISEKTSEHVKQIASQLGYVPDTRAIQMRYASVKSEINSKTIGVLVPDLRNPYFAELTSVLATHLYEAGFYTLIGTSDENLDRQHELMHGLLGQRIDGALVVPQGPLSSEFERYIEQGHPVVFVDRKLKSNKTVPTVVSNPIPGIREAIKKAKSFGHTKISFVGHPALGSYSVNLREETFCKLMNEQFQIPLKDCSVFHMDHNPPSTLINGVREGDITCLIFAYSPDAITVISSLQEAGLANICSVISFDDIPAFKLMSPQVDVISQDIEQIGRKGIEILLEALSGTPCHFLINEVPTKYVPRGTVRNISE